MDLHFCGYIALMLDYLNITVINSASFQAPILNIRRHLKAHYKFFYTPVHMSKMTEDHVLLDILFEEPHYAKIINFSIDSSFIKQDGHPIKVNIPCHEDILGDKLTAFAPNTTGIPYEKSGDSRTMEIMKQLFDIGSLL